MVIVVHVNVDIKIATLALRYRPHSLLLMRHLPPRFFGRGAQGPRPQAPLIDYEHARVGIMRIMPLRRRAAAMVIIVSVNVDIKIVTIALRYRPILYYL